CHTNGKAGKPFAGGLPMETPIGTIYSTNITPDKEHGIGAGGSRGCPGAGRRRQPRCLLRCWCCCALTC
ncbi:hypothetical protein FK513_30055, partial [Klebsiella pneumoniae]|nr:hypothetical protein [Klebsiella pneumoniae]